MMIGNGDGTFTGGPLDVLLVLHDTKTGRFHPAFLEEKPMPGPVPEVADTHVVRLTSRMHHTEGFPTLEEGLKGLKELAEKIHLPPENTWEKPREWDGEYPITMLVDNWRKKAS